MVAATSPTELTAGEHAIEVDYAANSKTILKCILSWQNDASIDASEVIPQTQFKPAATDVFPAYVYGALNAVWSAKSPLSSTTGWPKMLSVTAAIRHPASADTWKTPFGWTSPMT